MHISQNRVFRTTTNGVVSQLGALNSQRQNIETLEQLQWSRSKADENQRHNLDRMVNLVRAQGRSAVHESKAIKSYVATTVTLLTGAGMVFAGDSLPIKLAGAAIAVASFLPLGIGNEHADAATNVLSELREDSFNDGVLEKDQFDNLPEALADQREEALLSTLEYTRRANAALL